MIPREGYFLPCALSLANAVNGQKEFLQKCFFCVGTAQILDDNVKNWKTLV